MHLDMLYVDNEWFGSWSNWLYKPNDNANPDSALKKTTTYSWSCL
jgi:hypothetical protein